MMDVVYSHGSTTQCHSQFIVQCDGETGWNDVAIERDFETAKHRFGELNKYRVAKYRVVIRETKDTVLLQ